MSMCSNDGWLRLTLVFLFLEFLSCSAATTGTNGQTPPHILFVLIDDLGWGDVGFHQHETTATNMNRRPEVQTPVMDRLAQQEGLQLHRHYVHCSCTGTRTALQSGRFPVHVQTTLKNPEVPSSGMPRNLTGLAEHLKRGGYATHYVGKWDVGMATPKHTPKGRGYDTSLNYFEHKNDFFTQACMQSVCCKHHMQQQNSEGAMNNNQSTIYDLWDTDKPARALQGTDYEEFIFQRRMLEVIDNHAAKQQQSQEQQPLFLFYAPHVAHCPLSVPKSYLDHFDFMDDDETYDDGDACKAQTPTIVGPGEKKPPRYSCRKQYHAMVKLMDDILGSLVERLQRHGMWENTLMVVTSDNGGPVNPEESAATNYPLRGGKYSDWEGGVRATAFISGGYLPMHRRGKILEKPIHICDWYATLPALVGVDVREHNQQDVNTDKRVPPVDAVNVWPLIVADEGSNSRTSQEGVVVHTVSPRKEIPLSKHALIVGNYKLIWNEEKLVNMAGWTYADYPTAHTKGKDEIYGQKVNCTAGCLFNVHLDPGEHKDISKAKPFLLNAMKKRLLELREGFYDNDDRGRDSCPKDYRENGNNLPCACWMATNYYGGFLGPYQEVDLLPDFLERLQEKEKSMRR
ncbi:Arylsulfatase I [Seminavis robusta]|uniref:Arylsulfatase I n=1 Tax=Seminavis robusta TaxID=568900 RepID=A0A9N8E010_9STRA|nr:Arylsulfatase I [Seminavis robusta]|eukprot:Sro514_g158170.1 Arylsulfatase I (627) ;mRNA; f:55744-57748